MTECINPTFGAVESRIAKGEDKKIVCNSFSKVGFWSQLYLFYADCPVQSKEDPSLSLLYHPDAILADCVMNGDVDTEDVRMAEMVSGGVFPFETTKNIAARHYHDVGLSSSGIIHKYSHYAHPQSKRLDAIMDVEAHNELRWRSCERSAPDLGTHYWHTRLKPGLYARIRRGYLTPANRRIGVDRPLNIEEASQAQPFYWEDAKKQNAWVALLPSMSPGKMIHVESPWLFI